MCSPSRSPLPLEGHRGIPGCQAGDPYLIRFPIDNLSVLRPPSSFWTLHCSFSGLRLFLSHPRWVFVLLIDPLHQVCPPDFGPASQSCKQCAAVNLPDHMSLLGSMHITCGHLEVTISSSLVAQVVNNLPAMQETWVRSLGWEDPLEKGKAIHSSILA